MEKIEAPITYAFVGGMHVFSSTIGATRGLFAASTSLEEACAEIGKQLTVLFEENSRA